MKEIKQLFFLVATLGFCVLVNGAAAQTFKVVHAFSSVDPNIATNSDGAFPDGGLALSEKTIYGTTGAGGNSGMGTVFKMNLDGSGFVTLHSFSLTSGHFPYYTNTDGAAPLGITVSDGTAFGVTRQGGAFGSGTVFRIGTNGSSFSTVHHFSALSTNNPNGNADGARPSGSLLLVGDTLYGTTERGGSSDGGVVFSLTRDGSTFAVLHDFTCSVEESGCAFDGGEQPESGVILLGDTLYGTTYAGGLGGNPSLLPFGTAFALHTNGTFKTLFTFVLNQCDFPPCYNSNGLNPSGGLVSDGTTVYGMTYGGGLSNSGTIFAIGKDGTGFRTVHIFSTLSSGNTRTNSDGAFPYGNSVTLIGSTLFGTANQGGGLGLGTVFSVHTDGSGFTTLHSFSGTSDGANPTAWLTLAGNTLYGTTIAGGQKDNGTIFSITVKPELTITHQLESVILSWPTNFTGFTLQSTTNIVSPIWTTVSASPVAVNGQNTVTAAISGAEKFYRLSQ